MKKFTILLIISLIAFGSINAKCRRIATVKYQQEYGWSKKYTVEVNFMTGMELNKATQSYKYDSYKVYAIIFWGEGQATVIKLTNNLPSGYEVECSLIDNITFDLQGYDQDDDKWNICLGQYCF